MLTLTIVFVFAKWQMWSRCDGQALPRNRREGFWNPGKFRNPGRPSPRSHGTSAC